MPTYEYRCNDCGNLFEIVQSIADEPLTTCERCGGTLRKVFHPAGIVFKGSGFYATDSRSRSKPKEKAESTSDKRSDKKETKATEKVDSKKSTEKSS